MKKENIIEFMMYSNLRKGKTHNSPPAAMSDELKNAIQLLILRLREQGPIRSR